MNRRVILAIVFLGTMPFTTNAFDHNESVHGDLSNIAANPSQLFLDDGANVLTGSVGSLDHDYLTFDVGGSQRLDEIIVNSYSGISVSFIGLQSGSAWTAGEGFGINPALLLGWTHFGSSDLGTDIMDDMSIGFGSMGFTPPLGPGSYSFLLQDTGGTVSYSMSFMVSSTITGDFDGNGLYECADIDPLVAEIVSAAQGGTPDPRFDLTQDGAVNRDDLTAWRIEAGNVLTASGNPILEGDANLDGSVDGSDFGVWNASKFTQLAAWCSGDFSADGNVDGSDFGIWNSNKFQSADGSSIVPEPYGGLWCLMLGSWFVSVLRLANSR